MPSNGESVSNRLFSRGMELLDPYSGWNVRHRMKCRTCGHVFDASPATILFDRCDFLGCRKCMDHVAHKPARDGTEPGAVVMRERKTEVRRSAAHFLEQRRFARLCDDAD